MTFNQYGPCYPVRRGEPLTDREKICLELLVEGYNNLQIAARVEVDPAQITRVFSRAAVKLGADTVPQLAVKWDRMRRKP